MQKDALFLAIDVGTGSVRAALVDQAGKILSLVGHEHQQIVPRYGWSEQRPFDWWQGACLAIRQVLDKVPNAAQKIQAVCACGQMHGTVLLDEAGNLAQETAPLWNDKRAMPQVKHFQTHNENKDFLDLTANPPTPAWPAFKLQWLQENAPEIYARTACAFMPKDYLNFQLCGERAMDWMDASTSFLMDVASRDWSDALFRKMGLLREKLPAIRSPLEILGGVHQSAALATGLREGTPVLVGGADYPVSMIGSGVVNAGMGSDITGTSSIITVLASTPLCHPEVSNVATTPDLWGRFMLLDSGGDAVRWARRAFHQDKLSYADLARHAEGASAGSEHLFFLPYLSGERFGTHANSRAQFFGLTARHGLEHLHRAILEGVAFGVRRHISLLTDQTGLQRPASSPLERIVAASGGAKSALWLQIKASMYKTPILVSAEPEAGVIGCAMLAACAMGEFSTLQEAARHFVHYAQEIPPDPKEADIYDEMMPLFERLYHNAQAFYDDLDALDKRHDVKN